MTVPSQQANSDPSTDFDTEVLVSKIIRRKYKTYEDYLSHQASKLDKVYDEILESDVQYQKILEERFRSLPYIMKGKSMLCLGARLGGEVRAFKNLGAVAVGIDLNPGPANQHVLIGDIHEINFATESFDYAFSNIIDHVFDVEKFCSEIVRILKSDGMLFLECGNFKLMAPKYEAIDTSDLGPIMNIFGKHFQTVLSIDVINKTNYINWQGTLFCMKKI